LRSWEHASVARASAAQISAAVAGIVPASALILLRTFVLQQVPLKATAEPSLAFVVTLSAVVVYRGTNPWVLVAAADYLARHGSPATPAELGSHEALIYSSVQGDERWHFSGADGRSLQVPVKGPLRSNNLSALLAAARAGLGLAALPWYVAHASVRDGAVQPLLTDWTLPSQEIHAVFSSPRLVPTKVSGFVDFLQQRFGADWWIQASPLA
jgi:DNA-binding transcriptional LysR family regulator